MKSLCVTIQVKATEQYVPAVLFIMLYKMVCALQGVEELCKVGSFK